MGESEELADPLGQYQPGVEPTLQAMYQRAEANGERVLKDWAKGGPPVMLTREALWFADDETSFRIPADEIRKMGQTRSTDYNRIRWGLGAFLLGIVVMPFLSRGGPIAAVVSGLLMLLGGYLVVKGFLANAILVQTDDERLPPFVIDHRKFKSIRRALDRWDPTDE